MKARLPFGMAALLALAAAACSQAAAPSAPPPPAAPASAAGGQQQTLPGSYIVQAPGNGEQAIRRVFGEYGITLVRPLGNEQFEVRLSRDPGLDALQRQVAGSRGAVTAVQPNFVYRIQ